MQFANITPFNGKSIQAIVETPRGSSYKYTFDATLQIFRIKKILPMGMMFPFDFGFIPNTTGGDGDPIDVLIMMDQPAYPGCLVDCRVLGVLIARQQEKNRKPFRNDRIIAVASHSHLFRDLKQINALNQNMSKEVINFFIDYNKHMGKKFTPLKFAGANQALRLIHEGMNENIAKGRG